MRHYFHRLIMPVRGQHFWVKFREVHTPYHSSSRSNCSLDQSVLDASIRYHVDGVSRMKFTSYNALLSSADIQDQSEKNSTHFWMNITQQTQRIKEGVMCI